MMKEKRDIRPILIKFGVAVALSFAGFLFSRVRTKRIKPPQSPRFPSSDCNKQGGSRGRARIRDVNPEIDSVATDTQEKSGIQVRVDSNSAHNSPSTRHSGEKDRFLLPEFDELVRHFDVGVTVNPNPHPVTSPKTKTVDRDEYEQEIQNLKNMIRFLRERERHLEFQLLEYYGLKEQETTVMELENRLKINNMEAKIFTMKITSLQADNKRLEARVADYSRVVTELDAAKAKIKMLKKKLRHEAEQNKVEILALKQRVERLQEMDNEASRSSNFDVESSMRRIKELEAEALALRRSNSSLKQENCDLGQRLESTQMLATSMLEDPELEELRKLVSQLQHKNETLSKEVESLQADRCLDAEELVYLRWINACLRYELRNYQRPHGKTIARDLSKSLSPKSEEKAKQLILEYADTEGGALEKEPSISDFDVDQWPSSQPSYLTETGDPDESPGSSSSTNKTHTSKKRKFLTKLRKLIRGHHNHNQRSDKQSPTLSKAHSMEDFGRRKSLFGSPRGEEQSPRLASSSQNSTESSLEFNRLTSLNEEDVKELESTAYKSSDSGSSRRFVSGQESISSSPLDCRPDPEPDSSQKSELARYAEALKESPWTRRMMHRKSASYSPG